MRKIAICIAIAFLSGCAFTTENIDISYKPQTDVTQIKGADVVEVSLKLNDDRQDRSNKVSSKKNGFGMETAPILANEDVLVTFRKAIEHELSSRGFKIGNKDIVTINMSLIRFWNDHKLGFFAGDSIAELNMSISVKGKNDKIQYSKIIIAQGKEENIQLMTGENAKLALDRALADGIKQLFDDKIFLERIIEASK